MERSWNPEQAIEQLGGDRVLLAELIHIFLDDAPRLIAELRAGILAKDVQAIERAAHALKGSVVNFAAQPVRDLAYDIEMKGRSKNLDGIADSFERLEAEYGELENAMRRFF